MQWAYHLILPWIAFGVVFAAIYARMIRASIIETLDAEHVRTARAFGMSEWRILKTQVLRNALLPIVTMLGMDVGIAFSGAIFVERAFGLPGIGPLLFGSLARRETAGDPRNRRARDHGDSRLQPDRRPALSAARPTGAAHPDLDRAGAAAGKAGTATGAPARYRPLSSGRESQSAQAFSKWARGRAPTTVERGCPLSNRITVGSERTP